jgi:hypothetical protein
VDIKVNRDVERFATFCAFESFVSVVRSMFVVNMTLQSRRMQEQIITLITGKSIEVFIAVFIEHFEKSKRNLNEVCIFLIAKYLPMLATTRLKAE